MSGISRRNFLSHLAASFVGSLAGGKLIAEWYEAQAASPLLPMQGLQVAPATVTTASGLVIHNIQTGYVAVKRAHRSYNGPDNSGILAIIADPNWTEWLPINTWLIEHPEGLILFDTGETSLALSPDYHNCDPGTAFFYHSFLRFAVTPEDEIGAQLASLGIAPRDIRWLVQSHLHGDHVGGLKTFPNAEVLLSPLDYPNATGTLPCHYPPNFNPQFVDYRANDLPVFGRGYALTQAEDVWIVPTAGHSAGHQSLLLRDGESYYFFAGDTSFSETQMLETGLAGIAADASASRQTLQQIQAFCRQAETVYLPSHDAQARERLLNRSIVSFA